MWLNALESYLKHVKNVSKTTKLVLSYVNANWNTNINHVCLAGKNGKETNVYLLVRIL